MKSDALLVALIVLAGCTLTFSQENFPAAQSPLIDPSVQYKRLKPGTKIYFHTIDDKLVLGPKLTSDGDVTIYTLGEDGVFKNHSPKEKVKGKSVKYTVLKSGVLVPKAGGKSIKYNYGENGDLVPDSCNECVYRSDKPTYYIKGFKNILIPVEMLYSKDKLHGMFKDKVLFTKALKTEKEMEKELEAEEPKIDRNVTSIVPTEKPSLDLEISSVVPDKTCNGDITLFILRSDGSFKRTPSDPYLPMGMKMSYKLLDNLLMLPFYGGIKDFVMSYLTGKDGDLIPHKSNVHEIKTEPGSLLSFMLGERGYIFPVKEKIDSGKSVSYYFNGNLIHRSQQFSEVFANSSTVLINNEKYQLPDGSSSPELKCSGANGLCQNPEHHVSKRDVYYSNPVYESCNKNSYQKYRTSGGPYKQVYEPQPTYRVVDPPINPYETYVPPPPPPPPPRRCPPPPVIPPYQPPVLPPYQPPVVPPYQPPVLPPARPCPPPPVAVAPCPPPPAIPPIIPTRPCSTKCPIIVPPITDLEPALNCDCPCGKEPQVRTDLYVTDSKGNQISIIPEITDDCDVVLYKLTCKGHLIRFPQCTEPEYGYDILFELLLDEFILVPTSRPKGQFTLTYQLQENGNLIPEKWNKNTFKKPPGSLIYFMLGKNNILFPVQQRYECDGSLSYFFQNKFLLRLMNPLNKPIYFTTLSTPIYAYVNNFTMITCSTKPRISPNRGSNWRQFRSSSEEIECSSKNIYLVGPRRQNIKIVPYRNRKGVPAVYILDCNGVFYRSPKDKKKCVILRSYILLKEQILVPTNDTEGYIFAESKNGDMYPYLFPGGKLAAPVGQALFYLLCQKGVLLPVCIEVIGDYVCYIFDDNIILREKVFCKKGFDYSGEIYDSGTKELSCKESVKDFELFTDENGENVYFEKIKDILKRHPSEVTPETLIDRTASFQIQKDGSLIAVEQQAPSGDIINMIMKVNGDFKEDPNNEREPPSHYYVLSKDGELIAATAKKTKDCITFYTKCNRRLFKVCSRRSHGKGRKIGFSKNGKNRPDWNDEDERREKFDSFRGNDDDDNNSGREDKPERFDLLPDDADDRFNNKGNSKNYDKKNHRNQDDFCKYDKIKCKEKNEPCDKNSQSIFIPLKSATITEACKCCPDHLKSKCEEWKNTLKELTRESNMKWGMEMQLDDQTMKDIAEWAQKCSKVLHRRDLAERINECIKNLREAGVIREDVGGI